MKTLRRSSLAAALLLVGLLGCYTNPLTGRRSVIAFTPQREAALGLDAFAQIKQETPISNNPTQNALVSQVGQRIAGVVDLPYAQWEFVLFQADDTPNAFCLPGGKVGVYTGIFPITQNDAGLATVVGHEVAHAVARHGGERMTEQLALQMGGMALDVALQEKPQKTRELAQLAYGVTATLGVELPHSRKQELEADRMGLVYMARAGFDPREAIAFWQRFKAFNDQHGSSMPKALAFLSTHPLDDRRISELEKHLPDAIAIYEGR